MPSAYTSSCLHRFKNLSQTEWPSLNYFSVSLCRVLSSRKSLLAKTSSKCLMHTEVAAAAFKRPPPPPPPCQGSSQQGFHFVHHHHLPGCISIVRGRITAPRLALERFQQTHNLRGIHCLDLHFLNFSSSSINT